MNERQDRPVLREEPDSTIRMALFKARRLWSKARPGDHDRLNPMAAAVADKCRARHLSTNVEQIVMES